MVTKRALLHGLGLGAAAFQVPGAFAAMLEPTARTGDGPFYPDKMPLDTDNDLIIINDGVTPAVGEITHLTGRVLGPSGAPVRNAFVEIWQADAQGSYIHADGENEAGRDGNFQGYGRFLTDAEGRYYFRTIKPVSYTLLGQFRAPHIHFAVSKSGRRLMATQAMVAGHPYNARDFVLDRIRDDAAALASNMVAYQPLEGSKIGELTASFDVVLGVTPRELEDGTIGGIGEPERG
jgi:protocatechuate 3,4-dioxygenase beta subunit